MTYTILELKSCSPNIVTVKAHVSMYWLTCPAVYVRNMLLSRVRSYVEDVKDNKQRIGMIAKVVYYLLYFTTGRKLLLFCHVYNSIQ